MTPRLLRTDSGSALYVAGIACVTAIAACAAVTILWFQVQDNSRRATEATDRARVAEEQATVLQSQIGALQDDLRTMIEDGARLRALLLAAGIDPGPPPVIINQPPPAGDGGDADPPSPSPRPSSSPAHSGSPSRSPSRSPTMSGSPCVSAPVLGRRCP